MAERSRPLDWATRALAAGLERLPSRQPSLAILTYHRVEPADERPDLHPGLRVAPEAFRSQLAAVTRRAQPVSLDDLLRIRDGRDRLPARAVHVTLDDAYASVEHHAWPALQDAGVPATLFVPTSHPDSERTFWWDRLHHALLHAGGPVTAAGREWPVATDDERARTFRALRDEVGRRPHDDGLALVSEVVDQVGAPAARPANIRWATLRRMAIEGLALAPHSRTHPLLHRLPDDAIDDEVAGSWHELQARVGPLARPAFAPPGGGSDARVAAAIARAGLGIVMTTVRGVNTGVPEWTALRRVNVGAGTPVELVRIQLRPQPHQARAGASAARARVRATTSARGGASWS